MINRKIKVLSADSQSNTKTLLHHIEEILDRLLMKI